MNYIGINKPGESTVIMIMVPVGAYYESVANLGIAHFLEHMLFKGTVKRPKNKVDEEIEDVGGEINAFTDWEMTAYYAKIANRYTQKAAIALTDMVFNATFPAKEVDKERNVIIQEMKMYEDRPTAVAESLFYGARYSNRFKVDIVGTEKTLYNTQRKDLVAFRDKHYTKQNAIMIAVGNVDNQFSDYKISEDYIIKTNNYLTNPIENKFFVERDLQQANLVIGNDVELPDESFYILDVLSSIYNDMNGRLFKVIREKYGMVYGISFGVSTRSNGHYEWQVTLGLEKKNIKRAQELIIKELTRPVSDIELKRGILKTTGSTALYLDSNYRLASLILSRARMGKNWKDYGDYVNQYKTSLKEINTLIKQFNFEDHIIAGVIPKKNKNNLDQFAENMLYL
jgi:predicted Zn-dependent peptidase